MDFNWTVPMEPLESQIMQTIAANNLIGVNRSILVGVSGGPDSICLLHLLSSLFQQITYYGVYIDHNLRPKETPAERELVETLCRTLSIEFIHRSIDVTSEMDKTGESPEACARKLRYHALEKIRQSLGAGLIAVGHTCDDQVEEVLIRLIRGTGLKGLSGMEYTSGRVIRPLLDISKPEILSYLEENNFKYCEDSSNKSSRFLRNRVRHDLLPILERDFNPAIRQTILKTTKILKDEERYLHDQTEKAYEELVSSSGIRDMKQFSLVRNNFQQIHPALQRRVIEKLCWNIGCKPNHVLIEDIITLGDSGKTGSETHLPDGFRVVNENDSLVFTALDTSLSPRDRLSQTFNSKIKIGSPGIYPIEELNKILRITMVDGKTENTAHTLSLDADQVTFPLVLRSPVPGECFQPLGAPGSKKIARFFTDKKTPKHQRHRYPLLISQEKVICIVGLAIEETCRITHKTSRCMLVEWLEEL